MPKRLARQQLQNLRLHRHIQCGGGFVQQQEVHGLAQAADEGHTLLLAEGEQTCRLVFFIADAQCVEEGVYLLAALEARQAVLEQHILEGRQLAEEAQFLEKNAERVAV